MGKLKDKLQYYAERLKDREDFFLGDLKRLDYFSENMANKEEDVVRQKLSVLNHHQIHDLACQEEMIEHILVLDIDDGLHAHEMQAVVELASFHHKGKDHQLLEFASAYVNSHHPHVYPVYSHHHIQLLEQYMNIHVILEDGESLKDYVVYKKGLDLFLDHHDLKEMLNYYEVGKLEWLYFDKLLLELNAAD